MVTPSFDRPVIKTMRSRLSVLFIGIVKSADSSVDMPLNHFRVTPMMVKGCARKGSEEARQRRQQRVESLSDSPDLN